MISRPSSTQAPLPEGELHALRQLAAGLAPAQLTWASGYLAGVAAERGEGAAQSADAAPAESIDVFYGSQTGNGRRLAESMAAALEQRKASVRCRSLADVRARDLAGCSQALFVVSTHGDGDPPDDAASFFDQLAGERMPQLNGLAFGVLALGDRSYEKFCETGRQLHERLLALGARPLLDRVDCDVDYDQAANTWLSAALDRVEIRNPSNVIRLASVMTRPHDRSHPAAAELIENQSITGRGSASLTHHLELAVPGLSHEPGDSLAVAHRNPPAVVQQVLAAVALDGEAPVRIGDQDLTLHEALAGRRELTRLSATVLERHLAMAGNTAAWTADDSRRREVLARWQYAELAQAVPIRLEPQALVDLLPPPRTRLYSIASDPGSEMDEVHLTVAAVCHPGEGLTRHGAASSWLMGLEPGAELSVWVEPNAGFRLPPNPATPILMVAAGTGIAPFRAFLKARTRTGGGRSWLLFGHRHRRTDFLYQAEWLRALQTGELSRLDTAFSRDGNGPRYVQDALFECGAEVFRWLEEGGHVYVCGSIAMGRGVDETLAEVVNRHGGTDGKTYLQQLKAARRYQRDVY